MAICKKLNLVRTQICTGDLDKYIGIYLRTLLPAEAGSGGEPIESFTLIKNVWAGIETPSPLERFNGITINDRISNLTTHVFYIYYDSSLPDLETGNHFVKWNDDNFRILSVKNNDEQDQFIMIFATNRGDDDLEASEA